METQSYCETCRETVEVKQVDAGIGQYECHGHTGTHHAVEYECVECGGNKLKINEGV